MVSDIYCNNEGTDAIFYSPPVVNTVADCQALCDSNDECVQVVTVVDSGAIGFCEIWIGKTCIHDASPGIGFVFTKTSCK